MMKKFCHYISEYMGVLVLIPGVIFSVWHNISGAIVARIYTKIKDNTI